MTEPTTRLDKLVADRFGLSRRAAQEAILNGRIDMDGTRCDEPGRLVASTVDLRYDPNRPKARRVVGVRLRVLYQDPHVLIVDKPPGLLTLETAAHEDDTLAARTRAYLTIRHGKRPYVGIIHRLDKETSGAIALARSPEALAAFQALFRRHEIERIYLAVVEGEVRSARGTIDKTLVIGGDRARHRVARSATEGIHAVTHYEVVERFGRIATLLACQLETGRTHQIRLHLASIGHPVLGDARYRPSTQARSKAQFRRQALHAQVLGFRHPITGVSVRVEAEPPPDLAKLITDLRLRFGIKGAGG